MPKQTAVILLQKDWADFNDMVPAKFRHKALEAYLLQNYKLPDDFSSLTKKRIPGSIRVNLRLSNEAISIIDSYVQIIDAAEEKNTNRSVIIRDVIKGYIKDNSNRNLDSSVQEKKHATYYFERGTRELLDQFIGHRDRSSAIEHFILSKELDYSLLSKSTLMNNTPIESESIRINLIHEAVEVIENVVASIDYKVSVTAVMREVVSQLIQHVSGKSFTELLLNNKLRHVIDQYSGIVGYSKVEEIVSEYLHQNKSKYSE
ncbi:hypothetical protein AAXB25_22625 [Paenibacillus lautus]|uniref:hypothetical protein n=1 Tax=Paenibacillus lautus TaxID=1401 RepID=UPI003D2D1572